MNNDESNFEDKPNEDDEQSRFWAHQRRLREKLIEQGNSIFGSLNFWTGDKTFEQEVARFNIEFPDEKSCLEEIISRVHRALPLQCRCGSFSFTRERGTTKAKCTECNKTRSALSHCKYFRCVRKARLSLAAILMKERCADYSIRQFALAFAYAYSSCWNQAKKFELALSEHTETLVGVEEIYSGHYSGIFERRTRKTPIDGKPSDEQIIADANAEELFANIVPVDVASGDNVCLQNVPEEILETDDSIELDADTQLVFDLISDLPIVFDALCDKSGLAAGKVSSAIINLELDNLITKLPGDQFVLFKGAAKTSSGQINPRQALVLGVSELEAEAIQQSHAEAANSIIPLIRQFHQGISRKYLPLALADTWRSRTIWLTGKSVELFDICVQATNCARKSIIEFDCPLMVRIAEVL